MYVLRSLHQRRIIEATACRVSYICVYVYIRKTQKGTQTVHRGLGTLLKVPKAIAKGFLQARLMYAVDCFLSIEVLNGVHERRYIWMYKKCNQGALDLTYVSKL